MALKSKNKFRSKLLVLVVVLLVVLVIAGVVLIKNKNTKLSGTIPSTTMSGNNSAKSPANNSQNAGSSTPAESTTPPSTKTSSPPATPAGQPPATPSGTFVSNHNPVLSANTLEQSACNTSLGATCRIEFSYGGIVKTLQDKAVGSDGSIIWNWDIKQAGLSAGSWKITAIASFNGQTSSSVDPLMLNIQ